MGLLDKYSYEDILRKNANNNAYYVYEPNDNPIGFDMPVQRTSMEDILKQLYADPSKPVKVKERTQVSYDKTAAKQTYGTYTLDEYGMLQRDDDSQFYKKPESNSVWKTAIPTIASALTGGISDIGIAGYNTIKNSTSRDWEKLFSGGLSELGRGIKEGNVWGGITNWLGGVINNPLVNFSDDFLTSTGTIPQRALRDIGVMPQDVYDKNYKYTKDVAHIIGLLFAGGGSELLGGTPAGVGMGLDSGLAQQIAAAELYNTAPVLGASGANTLAQLWQTIGTAASNPFLQKLASTGLKKAGSIAMSELLQGSPSGGVSPTVQQFNPNEPYSIGGFLNTPQPTFSNIQASKTSSPSFELTALPKLSEYGDDKKKKLAELLTDPYKNYTLSDYALYKADPDQLRELIDSQYIA